MDISVANTKNLGVNILSLGEVALEGNVASAAVEQQVCGISHKHIIFGLLDSNCIFNYNGLFLFH